MARSPEDRAAARARMVRRQLAARGIRDQRVLDAMGRMPREEFVPPASERHAYRDGALGIGSGQTISQPYIVARMSEALHLSGTERVLEIGTGSGYQAAILAELAAHVYTVERLEVLNRRARTLLREDLGYVNISFRTGDGTLGWPEQAPFDRLIVTAAAPRRPDRLLEQLVRGGEGVVPVGGRHWQMLTHYAVPPDGSVRAKELCECVFVKLVGEEGW
ncbi:MAG: protein-L-isoaspartate(D-aspartate) O-methyltransferase [Planctomycetota bacterium]|jgi:protein-L-isoaspartate(D-aspartate) O-methyltransferase